MDATKAWRVAFTRQDDKDINGIFAFIADRDGADTAEAILNKFIQARDSLCELPDRGRIPPELKRVNILPYREIQILPYRIVYQASKATHEVHIHIVADGRRNFTDFLKERLLNTSSSKVDRQ